MERDEREREQRKSFFSTFFLALWSMEAFFSLDQPKHHQLIVKMMMMIKMRINLMVSKKEVA